MVKMDPCEKGEEAYQLVAASNLSSNVRKRICVILDEMGSDGKRRADVARELIAHFEDGLSAGRSVEEMLRQFGDARRAARLISKGPGRPPNVELLLGRGDSLLYILARNLRYAARHLRQNPGFAMTAVLSLALGLGANIAIFSLVNAVVLRQPPVEKREELVMIFTTSPRYPYQQFAYPDFEDLRDGIRDVFTGLAASVTTIGQVDRGGSVETILCELVSGNHFSLLGIEAAQGRTFTAADDIQPGAHPVGMISHGYWRQAFGGDPSVIGRDLRVNGRPYTILGIAPEDYRGSLRGMEPDFYAPIMMYDELQPDTRVILEARNSHRFFVQGRLKPGVTMAQAEVALERVATQFRSDYGWGTDMGFLLIPQEEIILHPSMDRFIRAAAWLLSAVVGLVLLISCTNLAGFLLARSLDRRKEIAIRLAMGARRRSLIAQILTETTLMSLLGGLGGIAVASGLLYTLTSVDLPLPLPIALDLGVDGSVLLFSLAVSIVAGLFLGLIPALQSTHLELAPTLKSEGAGSGTSRRRLSLRNVLVASQVAVCLVLLIGAGLFLRSLQQAQSVDPGFGSNPSAMLAVALSSYRYSPDEGRVFMRLLLDRMGQIPGVGEVGLTHNLQLRKTGRETMAIRADGVAPPPGQQSYEVDKAFVDPGFFDAVGIPILRGRNFDHTDRSNGQQVAIVSEAMAEKFWPGKEALGRRVNTSDAPDLMIVGVAKDTKVLDLSESPRPFIYRPYGQAYAAVVQIIARTGVDPARTAIDMVATARALDPELILWAPTTMERHLGFVMLPFRLSAWILSAFAVLAVALASIGLFGIVSYSVSQRTREVGIRMSLGANVRTVILTLMGSGMRLVAVGSLAGLVISLLLSRAVSGLLFGIEAFDAVTFVTAPLLLAAVAALAAYVAARRASRINPVNALRAE